MIVNIGKWVIGNLFIGFIREQQRRHLQDGTSITRAPSNDVTDPNTPNTPNRSHSSLEPLKMLAVNSGTVVSSLNMIPAVTPTVSPTARSSPLVTPLIPLHNTWRDAQSAFSSIPQSPLPMQDTTLTPIVHQRTRSGTMDGAVAGGLSTNGLRDDYFTTRTRLQSLQNNSLGPSDDFSGWTGPSKPEPQTPITPSGIMGRLKNLGKLAKKPVSEANNISTPESSATAVVGSSASPLVSLVLTWRQAFSC